MTGMESLAQPHGGGSEVGRCILCASNAARVISRIGAERIVDEWRRRFNIDIRNGYWVSVQSVEEYRCEECLLEFFPPALAGRDQLYVELQKFDWYYMPDKWEHGVAMRDIPAGARVLEVGCGEGAFVDRLRRNGIEARGIELNASAVQVARSRGLPVSLESLTDVVSRERGTYDVVCSFQVLEHVPDPEAFLRESVALLRKGGQLIFGVPNADSFIRHEFNILNMPPHHISRWVPRTVLQLERLFGLEDARVVEEPLASYHVMGYLAAHWRKWRRVPMGILVANPIVYRVVAALLNVTGLRMRLRGHSLYACLRVTKEPLHSRT